MELIIYSKYKKYDPVTVLYDECDHDLISKHKWHISNGYAMSRKIGYAILMHRLILGASAGEHVDHINHNRVDNRRENIRVCTHAENQRNRRSTGASKYLGVKQANGSSKFYASIKSSGVKRHLGTFTTEEEAAKAYDRAARFFHREFANPNFPNDATDTGNDALYYKENLGLQMTLKELISTKEDLKKRVCWGDLSKAAFRLNKCRSALSLWFSKKRACRVDYENLTAIKEVVEEREQATMRA